MPRAKKPAKIYPELVAIRRCLTALDALETINQRGTAINFLINRHNEETAKASANARAKAGFTGETTPWTPELSPKTSAAIQEIIDVSGTDTREP
jgi:hypothetical protein